MKTVIVNTSTSSLGLYTFAVITAISTNRIAAEKAVYAVLLEHFTFNEDEMRNMKLKFDTDTTSSGSFIVDAMCGTFSIINSTLTA